MIAKIKSLLVFAVLILLIICSNSCTEEEFIPFYSNYERVLLASDNDDQTPAYIEMVQLREKVDHPDYTILMERLRSRAQRDPRDLSSGSYSGPNGYYNGNIAKSAAFLFLLEQDEMMGEKAKNILLNGYSSFTTSIFDASYENVHSATAIIGFSQALDLMLAANYLSPLEKETIFDQMINWIDEYYQYFVEDYPMHLQTYCNNHNFITAAALGCAGLVFFFEDDRAKKWLQFAATEMDFYLDYLINEQGGYPEGYYYSEYGAQHYLPFIIGYQNFSQGETIGYENICGTRPPSLCVDNQLIMVEDFIGRENLKNHFDMHIKIRFPNGMKPPIEDALLYLWYGAIISGLYNDPVHLWDWENQASSFEDAGGLSEDYSSRNMDLTVDTILLYDNTMVPEEPDFGPSLNMIENGLSVFRSGWDEDAVYLMLNSENGYMRGWSHEHVDDFCFQIFAYGEYLVIDSGYIKWDKAFKVNQAINHSLITIDGNGPPENPVVPPPNFVQNFESFLSERTDTEYYQHVEATGTYESTQVTRKIIFVEDKYFIIEDTLESGSSHLYDWYLHLNGGGDAYGTYSLTENGTILTMPSGVKLDLYIENTAGPITSGDVQYITGWTYDKEPLHNAFIASINADNCKFVSLLIPKKPGQTFDVQSVNIGVPDTVCYIVTDAQSDTKELIISRTEAGTPFVANLAGEGLVDNISSVGDFLLLGIDSSNPDELIYQYVDNDPGFAYP